MSNTQRTGAENRRIHQLERELSESHTREAHLRAVLDAPPHDTQHVKCVCYGKNPTQVQVGYICNKCKALTLPAPPVVPVEDVKPLVDAIDSLNNAARFTVLIGEGLTELDAAQGAVDSALSTFTSKHKL